MSFLKPHHLKPGDTVATVSPSWGGPGTFPYIYENGLKVLQEWGLKIQELPHVRSNSQWLRENPKVRADDINAAFADSSIKAIFASIGGDDSVRILPFLDRKIIASNPKIMMGYSDTTTLHTFCNLLGLTTFYGPSIMAGFSQMESLPQNFKQHVHEMLFEPKTTYTYQAYKQYCEGYPNWANKENLGKTHPFKKDDGWHWLQGAGKVSGKLFGGCLEVFEMMKGTEFWPTKDFWKNKIFFLETSENVPTITLIDGVLRNYGMLGVFDNINGLIFARARGYSDEKKLELEKKIVSIVAKEFNRPDLPIVANFDVGHTDPQFVMPLGVQVEMDCMKKEVKLAEPWLT